MRHISKHKKEANFLNNPLVLYDEMATIFSIGMATGNYAKSSADVLSSDAIEDLETTVHNNQREGNLSENETTNNGRNMSTGESSRSKPPKQHKRQCVQDDLLLQTITDNLGKPADAIEKTGKNSEVPDDLWDHVSMLPEFEEVDLLNYLQYLCDNPNKARVFMMVPLSSKMVRVAKFFSENT